MAVALIGTPQLPLTAIDFDEATEDECILDDDVIVNLKEKGKQLVKQFQDEEQHYIQTKAFRAALKFLNNTNFIVIKGECGQGKSALARQLCLKIIKNGSYFIQTDLDTLSYHCNPSKRQVILLEDFLEGTKGKRHLPEDLQHQISYLWPFLRRVTKSQYVHIVATTRAEFLNDNNELTKEENLVTLPENDFIFDLNAKENELSVEENRKILESLCKQNSIEMPDTEEDLLKTSVKNLPFSFFLYSAIQKEINLNSILEEGPQKWLFKFFDALSMNSPSEYSALLFLSFTGGNVTNNAELFNEEEIKHAEHFIDKEYPADKKAAINELLQKLKNDETGLVYKYEGEFKFIHRAVYETLAKHLGDRKSGPVQHAPLFHLRDFYIYLTGKEKRNECNISEVISEDDTCIEKCIVKSAVDCLPNKLVSGIHSGELANVFYIAKKFEKNFSFEETLCSLSKEEIHVMIYAKDNLQPWQTFTYWVAKLGYQNLLKKIKSICKHGLFSFLQRSRPSMDPMSLFGAVEGKQDEILAELLKFVPNKDHRCTELNGQTVMHVAAKRNNKAAANILLKSKVKLDERDNDWFLPIHLAAQVGAAEIVEKLLLRNKDGLGKYDNHVLHYASLNGHYDVVEMYKDNPFYVLRPTSIFGFEPIHFASISGNEKIFSLLTESDNGIFTNATDLTGHKAIHMAARYGNISALQMLTDYHPNTDIEAQGGRKPIHHASRSGSEECIELLLERGANIKDTDDAGHTVLHFASSICSPDFIKFIISKGVDVSAKNKLGMEPIHYACVSGCSKNVEVMLDAGADLHAKDADGKPPILFAASNGQTDTVNMLLHHGVLVHEADSNGHDTLMYAASSGHFETVELLIKNGADVKAVDKDGIGAIQAVVSNGYLKILKLLLQHGADPFITDNTNRQLLQFAASNGHIECLKFLTEIDVDIRHKDDTGMEPIHYACSNGHLECLTAILEKGASVKARDNQGREPIHFAVSNGHSSCLKLLIQHDSDIRARDDEGREPLHYSSSQGQSVCTRTLIGQGACIEVDDNTGKKPMHYAARSDQAVSVIDLLHAGAKIDATDYEGRQPIHHAALQGLVEMVVLLSMNGACVTARDKNNLESLHFAAASGNLDLQRTLLHNGANLEARDSNNWTPLLHAVKNNAVESLEDLLGKFGANVAAHDIEGKQAIHYAAYHGFKQCTIKLLNHGADARAQTKDGSEPIHFAAFAGAVEIMLILNQKGAHVNAKNRDGNEAIHAAATVGSLQCLEFLIEHKADPNAKNKEGRNPVHMAVSNGHEDCLKYLLANEAKPSMADQFGTTPIMFAASNGRLSCLKLLLNQGAEAKEEIVRGRMVFTVQPAMVIRIAWKSCLQREYMHLKKMKQDQLPWPLLLAKDIRTAWNYF